MGDEADHLSDELADLEEPWCRYADQDDQTDLKKKCLECRLWFLPDPGRPRSQICRFCRVLQSRIDRTERL
jgi:hypothetical protein